MDRKQRRLIIKQVAKQFTGIYSTATSIGKDYETGVIPLKVLYDLCDTAKIEPTIADTIFTKKMVEHHNNICDKLYLVFTTESKRMNDKGCSLDFIKMCVSTVNTNFANGLNGDSRGKIT